MFVSGRLVKCKAGANPNETALRCSSLGFAPGGYRYAEYRYSDHAGEQRRYTD